MTAKDLVIDFLNYLFLLLLGVFFLFYVIFGNRLGIFQEILKILLPFSIFGILFLVVLRVRIINIKKYKKENIDEETIVYLTRQDRHKDLLVRLGLPVIILFIAALDGSFDLIDVTQSLLILIFNFAWHKLFLRPYEANSFVYLTRIDRIKDELFCYLQPLLIITVAGLNRLVDMVDIMQSLTVFSICLSWHLLLFKR